jgi:hypothetical protein
VTDDIPFENITAMVRAVRDFSGTA